MLSRKAAVATAAASEGDPEKRAELLRRAVESFPGERVFEQWLNQAREQAMLARQLIAAARENEDRGCILEALERWRMLEGLFPEHPVAKSELARVTALAGSEPFRPIAMAAGATAGLASSWSELSPAFTSVPQPPTPARQEPATELPKPAQQPSGPSAVERSVSAARAYAAQAAVSVRRMIAHGGRLKPWQMIAAVSFLLVLISGAVGIRYAMRRPAAVSKAAGIPVAVQSGAAGATIRIGEHSSEPGGDLHLELKPGSYPVTETKAGYQPYSATIQVVAGDSCFAATARAAALRHVHPHRLRSRRGKGMAR